MLVEAGGYKSNQHSCDLHKVVSEVVGALSSRELQDSLRRLVEKLAAVRESGESRHQSKSCRQRPRRPGWVLKAVVQVMVDRAEPMRAKDIHAAVEALVGEPVARSSVKDAQCPMSVGLILSSLGLRGGGM